MWRHEAPQGATMRLGSGKDAMSIRARGRHRFGESATPNDLTIMRKSGEWFASVTLCVSADACARVRTGEDHRGVDFGLNDWATFDNGETIAKSKIRAQRDAAHGGSAAAAGEEKARVRAL